MRSVRKLILLCTVLGLIICTFLFDNTEGLIDSNNNYVYDYMSSGSNDNLCINLAIIIFLPYCLFLFTLKKHIMVYEFCICNLSLLLQVIMLSLIDVGSIMNTIKNGNIPLLFWCLCCLLIFLELNGFFIYEKSQTKRIKMEKSDEKN